DSQIGRFGLRAAEKFGKEECPDTENWEQDKAFVEHQAAELIRKQATWHRFGRGNHKDSSDCIHQPKENQHELRRRQIVSSSCSPRHHADKEQEQHEKDDVAYGLSLCEVQESAHYLQHKERASFGGK